VDIASVGPRSSAVILDGAAVVKMLPPRAVKTFLQYGENVFIPYLDAFLSHCQRLDIVWDEYHELSLKEHDRELRGKGARLRVLPQVNVPTNWHGFLRVNDNKRELFTWLSRLAVQSTTRDIIIFI